MRLLPKRVPRVPPPHRGHYMREHTTVTTRSGFLARTTERLTWKECDGCGVKEFVRGWERDDRTNTVRQMTGFGTYEAEDTVVPR